MANKIRLGRATKARIETIKETLLNYELVYSMDTHELGVKNSDGTITYFGVVTELEWANILNKPNFATVATSGSYNDLSNKPSIPAPQVAVNWNSTSGVTAILNKPNLADVATSGDYADLTGKPDFATVATSGKYTDLTDKPDLALKLDKNFSALPAQTNPLLTDVLVLNRGTTAQKVTLGNLLAQVDNEIFIIVSTLPTTGVANKIYLVPSNDPEAIDNYVEWLWYDGKWERLGGFTLDLSNYFTKNETTGLLNAKVDKNENITAGTHTKITYDEKGLVTGGEALAASDIPNLNASKINAGTFADARIPNLNASKINAGVFNTARIPDLAISKITNLQTTLNAKLDANSTIDGGDL